MERQFPRRWQYNKAITFDVPSEPGLNMSVDVLNQKPKMSNITPT